MKKSIYIGLMNSMLMTMVGCDGMDESLLSVLPSDGYIYFNTEVSSRGELVAEMKGKSFGVTAFKYVGDWNTVKVQATPNVFKNHGQKVVWENGYHTYVDLVPWDATQKYTFFGYYPFDKVALSEPDFEGLPYVDYTLPTEVADMVDVMTASLYDTDNSSSDAVGLTFKHRLVAMDIQARNFLDEGVNVTINSLSMTFDNLQYNSVRIPLDDSFEITAGKVDDWDGKPTYSILSSPVAVEPTNTTSGTSIATSLSENSSLIFIPQTENLKGTITMNYEIGDSGEKVVSPTFDTGKSMLAGRKFYLLINFSQTSVSIAIVDSGEWEDENIEIEFE